MYSILFRVFQVMKCGLWISFSSKYVYLNLLRQGSYLQPERSKEISFTRISTYIKLNTTFIEDCEDKLLTAHNSYICIYWNYTFESNSRLSFALLRVSHEFHNIHALYLGEEYRLLLVAMTDIQADGETGKS